MRIQNMILPIAPMTCDGCAFFSCLLLHSLIPRIDFTVCIRDDVKKISVRYSCICCEIDPETLTLDLNDAERRITPKTTAIMPVYFASNSSMADEFIDDWVCDEAKSAGKANAQSKNSF